MLKFLNDFLLQETMWYFTEALCDDIECSDKNVSKYIKKLHKIIQKQRKIFQDFYLKIKEYQNNAFVQNKSIQTENESKELPKNVSWMNENTSIEEMVKEVAEDAMKQTGFVYEATSGLYYDYNSGYYYNAELGLYYDGNTGTYYYFDKEKNVFLFHSQVAVSQTDATKDSSQVNDGDNCKKRKDRKSVKKSKKRKKRKKGKEHDDIEEGECSEDSSQSSEISNVDDVNDKGRSKDRVNVIPVELNLDEMTKAWPPCMRIIVKETTAKNLKPGNLFIVTCEGGTLGREGNHSILIPDINISKYHAKLAFSNIDNKKEIGNYTLTDLGSRNGTFMNGKRLSTALQESEPFVIEHDSTIRIGGTTLMCHIHSGRETCPDCEPGLLISGEDDSRAAYVSQEKLSEKRKKQLKKLKLKFGLNNVIEKTNVTSKEYKDRAEIRRQTVGSSCEVFKTETASVSEPIKNTNKGFKMLAKMGWSEGQSLGTKTEEAIKEPILVEQRTDKVGLGFDGPAIAELPAIMKKKQELWKKVQDRYNSLE